MSGTKDRAIKELFAEVLKLACKDYVSGPTDEDIRAYVFAAREEAEEWLFSDSQEPGSFIWVCELLSVDPEAVRERVGEERQGQDLQRDVSFNLKR